MSVGANSYPVVLRPGGWAFEAQAGVTLLASALAAGVILPSSCRAGTCRTCICRVVSGAVAYSVEWPALSAEEHIEGFILPCVALPRSALVIEALTVADRLRGFAPSPASAGEGGGGAGLSSRMRRARGAAPTCKPERALQVRVSWS